jgi:signal transduction histidine kinase
MCVDPNWMPFEHINSQGKYEGILADYIKLFSQKLNIPFVLQRTVNYSQSKKYLKEDKCNIIVGDQPIKEVQKEFFTTKPYFVTPIGFVTHIDALLVHDFSQIAYSGTVGVIKDSPAQIVLPKIYKGIKIIAMVDGDKGLQKVASGELVAFVNVLPVLVYSIQKQGLTNVKISGTLPYSAKLSMLINKNHPELVKTLNKAIDTVTLQEQQKILNKWVKVKYEKGVDYDLMIKISILFLIAILFMIMRYLHIRKLKLKLEELHKTLEVKMQNEIEKNRKQQLLILQQNRLAQKGEMISMIAHQWRQPLNSLSLLHQTFVLKHKIGKVNEETLNDFNNTSKQLINQMSETIDDFRNFFQIDKSRVKFSIAEVISHAVSIIKPMLDKENIKIYHKQSELYYEGFPNELGQAIINIINNAREALAHKDNGDKIIEICYEENNGKIKICISDNGEGIPEDIISQIFDPYFSTKHDKHGTGLGLYMSKIIIEEHMNGKIIANNLEEGANIIIMLY